MESYDYIIIGAGICGAAAAKELTLKNKKVLILEAGEDRSKDRIQMSGEYAKTSRKTPGSPYLSIDGFVDSPDYRENVEDNSKGYYDFNRKDNSFVGVFKSTYQRISGGSTWHWLGNVPRFVPNDFKMKDKYCIGKNWPISYDELEPFYCKAEWEIGVSGNHEKWDGYLGAYRSKPYPMSEIWESYSDTLIINKVEGKTIQGSKVNVLPTPQARNSENYDGRPPCAGNSSCVPICPIQAKYDATVHVRQAVNLGADIKFNTLVYKLEVDDTGLINKIHCKTPGGELPISTGHATVILAAHTIESARLLLYSKISNSSGLMGKNLMDHAQGYVTAIANEKVYPYRGPLTTSGIDIFRDSQTRKDHAGFRLSIGNDGWGRIMSPKDVLRELILQGFEGDELTKLLEERITRLIRISFSTEVLPNEENRIELSEETDEHGIPKPKIIFEISDYNIKAFKKARQVAKEIFETFGCLKINDNDQGEKDYVKYSGAGHIIGTTCMGDKPSESVVDKYCRSHDNKNLIIVGASVFPTSGTANPTLTALALTYFAIDKHLSIEK